ncbi:hypothetical protein [Mesorhizobium sp. WSM4887]|uniref:hypothetical protein n=1 Tax=Mesorhizobium sp. WSM4887 TaxID=3038543 RepID=UPI002416E0CE|nr:hypothetical protein [Mesorhizobium sp. WSM4887]MDG4889816.1 hypothetical protein [Mesorhizobium sp. WSM4887]
MTDRELATARGDALSSIICRLDELRQTAASHGLDFLGYLLDVAFTESCDAIRKERSAAQVEETTIGTETANDHQRPGWDCK